MWMTEKTNWSIKCLRDILLTSEVEVLSIVIGSEINMFHDVSFGPIGMLTGAVFHGLQDRHAGIGKMARKRGLQGAFFRTTARIAGAAATSNAALLQSVKTKETQSSLNQNAWTYRISLG